MNILAIYAIAAGGLCMAFLLIQTGSNLISWTKYFSISLNRHLCLPVVIHRHRICGPWTRAGVLLHITYIAINIALVFVWSDSLLAAGRRSAELALINMIFPLSTAHLSYLAELLGISWRTCCKIHRATGWVTILMLSFHVITEAQNQKLSFSLDEKRNLITMIGTVAIGGLALLSIPYFRRFSYEIFLRGHQILAATFMCATWWHLETYNGSVKLYIYIAAGVFGLTTCLEFSKLLYLNGMFLGRGAPRALVSFTVTGPNVTAAQIQVILPRPIHVEPGQYINLWIPSLSLTSCMQTHPFTITSWSRGKQDSFKLLVQPRNGLSKTLARYGRLDVKSSIAFFALFTGPHGIIENTDRYETALLVTSGFGIAASIPHLKKMIHGYNTCTSHIRRLHLVWQIKSIEMVTAAEDLLSDLLHDDVIDKGYILSISIYVEHGLTNNKTLCGKHERLCYYQGVPDYRNIIALEASGRQITRVSEISDEPGRTLVIVSAGNSVRDHIRQLIREFLHQGVELSELEYQPE